MTAWDVLNEIMKNLPPIVAILFFLAAGVIFAIGFFQHGLNFIKYGFKQKEVGDLIKKIDDLRTEFHTELEAIKTNHFGHLKNFLGELTSILLDKNIINNTDKARLDNQLRDM
jgi:hypothetical protein